MTRNYSVTVEKDGPGRYFVTARQGEVCKEWSPRQLAGGHREAARRRARAIRAKLAAGIPLSEL